MRALIITVVVILGIIFLGGAVNLGSAPLFGHIDAVLGANVLMPIHYGVFWLLYRGQATLANGTGRTRDNVREFEKRPIGIDKEKKYQQLDEALK
jgi:succinate-acetate transporter protein